MIDLGLEMTIDPATAIINPAHFREERTAYCWDKDSTLADTSPRHRYAKLAMEGRITWAEYAERCEVDGVNLPVATLFHALRSHTSSLFVMTSAASASAMPQVHSWAERWGLGFDIIMLRREDEERIPSGDVKTRQIRQIQRMGIKCRLLVEDHRASAEAVYRNTGVPALCINPMWNEESTRIAAMGSGHI